MHVEGCWLIGESNGPLRPTFSLTFVTEMQLFWSKWEAITLHYSQCRFSLSLHVKLDPDPGKATNV